MEVIDDVSDGWTSLSGSQYELALTLKGGFGDLFKFNTGNAFVGFDLLGDMNDDGTVDSNDVPLFVQAIVDRSGYDANGFGVDADIRGDVNQDGMFDHGDLAGFNALFASSAASVAAASVPEPSALVLVNLILIGLAIGGRRVPRAQLFNS